MFRSTFLAALGCGAMFAAGGAHAQELTWSLSVGSATGVGVYVGVPTPVYPAPLVAYVPAPIYRPVYPRPYLHWAPVAHPAAPVYVAPRVFVPGPARVAVVPHRHARAHPGKFGRGAGGMPRW